MFLLSLYVLDIVNTSKTGHASKIFDIVRICVNNFNKTIVFEKKKRMHFKKAL